MRCFDREMVLKAFFKLTCANGIGRTFGQAGLLAAVIASTFCPPACLAIPVENVRDISSFPATAPAYGGGFGHLTGVEITGLPPDGSGIVYDFRFDAHEAPVAALDLYRATLRSNGWTIDPAITNVVKATKGASYIEVSSQISLKDEPDEGGFLSNVSVYHKP